MTYSHSSADNSSTAQVLEQAQLYGYRPSQDEPDPRPMPNDETITKAVEDIFDILSFAFGDSGLESDLNNVLWRTVNQFHHTAQRVARELDRNEQAQRSAQNEQDGSEVKSVDLERLIAYGRFLSDRRDALETFRDLAASAFEVYTKSPWKPHTGSCVNHRNLTSAMIDSRDYLAAKRRNETQVMMPAGTKVAISGDADFNDYALIWAKLDQVLAKYPDMVLLHGGFTKGAELIASKWADARKVPQIAFKPDFNRYPKAAPFKRNDLMLNCLPTGALVFGNGGIQANFRDKARKLGIPVMTFGDGA